MPKPWLNRRNLLQVNAFKSIFKQNLRLGLSIDEAFVCALEATSDEVFKKADPELVKKYLEKYGNKKTTIIHRVSDASC